MKSDLKITLTELGLDEDESRVYLAALRLGAATVQELATESGVPRTSIYNFLKPMLKKRLLFSSKRKKRLLYSAVHPNQLIEIQKMRLRELQGLMPELLALYGEPKRKARVSIYDGRDGIKTVLSDMLAVGEPICGWSDYNAMANLLGEYYFDVFPPERARRKIVSRNIVCDTSEAREFARLDNRYLRESKFWGKDLKTEINIYGNRVALNSYASEQPLSVLIEDEAIASTLRTVWQRQWDNL